MSKLKVISILALIAFAVYCVYHYFKFVTSGTWQGTLTGLGTLVLLAFFSFIFTHVNQQHEQDEMRRKNEEHLKKERQAGKERKSSPEYILANNPTVDQLTILLMNAYKLGLKASVRKRIVVALIEDQFEHASLADIPSLLKETAVWAAEPWWQAWKLKLEARIVVAERKKQLEEQIRRAEEAGEDVCWVCLTIKPKRCAYDYCNNCISGCYKAEGKYCHPCTTLTICGDPTCNRRCNLCN